MLIRVVSFDFVLDVLKQVTTKSPTDSDKYFFMERFSRSEALSIDILSRMAYEMET